MKTYSLYVMTENSDKRDDVFMLVKISYNL